MNFLATEVADYLRRHTDRFDDPVLIEMEKVAEEKGFPIVGRVCGAALEMMTRAIGGKRVFEMGSGYGFSAYWFARAVGEQGEVTLTDGDPANAENAEGYLSRAGLWDRCNFEVGDAIKSLVKTAGEFDVIYCDIDKQDYPQAFEAARKRLRIGGLYLCDNVLWSGRVARDDDDDLTKAIRRQNDLIYGDKNFLPTIIPLRDGIMAALRVG
jgi:predicted O-methyltransferase YrrM